MDYKADLVHQLILVFSDFNRVIVSDKIVKKLDKLNKKELLEVLDLVDKADNVIAQDSLVHYGK